MHKNMNISKGFTLVSKGFKLHLTKANNSIISNHSNVSRFV